jgi:hypothetical protein
MTRKRIILGASGIAVLAALLFGWLALRGSGDVSEVRIGFAGYGVTNGRRTLVLIVTNGSSYRISQPDGRYLLRGESPNSMTISSRSSTACGFGRPFGWWQLQIPKIPSVAPGATYRFVIPVEDGPYTWHVTVPFRTIPLRQRLPYAVGSRWPSSKRDTPISFEVSPSPIPPSSVLAPRAGTAFSIPRGGGGPEWLSSGR